MVAWNDKHGDASERRSAYAKASAYAEASARQVGGQVRSSFALASFRLRALRYGGQDGGQVEGIKRLEPPSPRLRPTLKLPPSLKLWRTRRHDKSAGQVRCLNTPSCIATKPRPRASVQSWHGWLSAYSAADLPRILDRRRA